MTDTALRSVRKGEGGPAVLIRRVEAIAVDLPLRRPMKMAGATVTHAQNLLVRLEAAEGTIGWGEAASAPTMTGDTQAGLKGFRARAAYCASKAALVGLTKAMAVDHSAAGVRVNCLCPGTVETPMGKRGLPRLAREDLVDPAQSPRPPSRSGKNRPSNAGRLLPSNRRPSLISCACTTLFGPIT